MDQPILGDKSVFPTQEIIFSHIGKSKTLWQALFESIHADHPDISEEWRYYNDGKSWLMKVTRKSKTVFWLSILKNSFRTTFYFSDKAKDLIAKSEISPSLKDQFKKGKKYGAIRGLTIVFKKKWDVKDAQELIGIKLSVK